MKSARTQATIEKGFLKIGLAMSRDFAGLMCNINDYIMHMHNSLDSPGYIAPEFRTEKVCFGSPGETEGYLAFHAILHLDAQTLLESALPLTVLPPQGHSLRSPP